MMNMPPISQAGYGNQQQMQQMQYQQVEFSMNLFVLNMLPKNNVIDVIKDCVAFE